MPIMVQTVAGHALITQVQLGASLNKGGRFLLWAPTNIQPFHDNISAQIWSLRSLNTFLKPIKETANSVFSPFARNSLTSFSKSHTKGIRRESLKHSARDLTSGRRRGLQEAQASTAEAAEETELKYLTSDYGWKVRFLALNKEEMDEVAEIQAEAFYSPAPFWDSFFFMIFKAEVLGALLYKIRNSPPNRYACLVAKADSDSRQNGMADKSKHNIVGVVDVTAYVEKDVLCHLGGAEEYLYVSGIAVGANYRRRKVATLLLKACDFMAIHWGFEYLVLRAYKDDAAATTLYSKAGYKVVFEDPPWTSTWLGRKQRVLMVKRTSYNKLLG